MKNLSLITGTILSSVLFFGCSGSGSSEEIQLTKEELGEKLFFDANLSLTRNTSCATCHDPENAFVDARFSEDSTDQTVFVHGALSVGDDGFSLGGRNAPTAAYAQFNPDFGTNDDGDYIGGQFHDGRSATLKDQAMGPPLDGAEMQMPDKDSVIERIQENSEYITAFENLYGDDIFDDINASYEAMAEAIAKFEKTEEFAPFDSKYDRFRDCREAGNSTSTCLSDDNWTLEEEAGYALFFSNANTNCATCHTIDSTSEAVLGVDELFTNFEYENIGTPRNIAAMDARVALGLQDANATFAGLGGTVEATDANYTAHLGKTKVPTLRNIAVTGPFMNNGVFAKLRTVIEFYDHQSGLGHHTNPETGEAWVANDHNETVNNEVLKETEALSDQDIRRLEAFLRTLTDAKYEALLPELAPVGEIGN